MRKLVTKFIIATVCVALCFTASSCTLEDVARYVRGDFDVSGSLTTGTTTTAPETLAINQGNVPTQSGGLADVIERIAPSVLEISVTYNYDVYVNFNKKSTTTASAAGSGVVADKDDKGIYIITNHHVVEDGVSETDFSGRNWYEYRYVGMTVSVRFTDGTECVVDKKLYENTDADVALLFVSKDALGNKYNSVVCADFPETYAVTEGEKVLAIGNPLGTLGGTVTSGIISLVAREIEVEGIKMTLLQTDAAINGGNSGGGLFNATGKLIGIVNAKMNGANIEGLGFAIPITTVIAAFHSASEPLLASIVINTEE